MRRRSSAGGEPAKAQRRKAGARKSRITPTAVHSRSSSAARKETKVKRLTRELKEARDRQRATAEVLSAISRSKFELQSILQSVVDTASQLCRADVSVIFRLEGGVYRFAAGYSLDPAYLEHERRTPISPGPGTVVGRAAMSREVVQIEDAWTDPLYEQKAAVKISGGRSMIGVPLMREGEPIGVIGLARTRVDPFTQREIELVTTFADQAVIAIENARLLNELRQRTNDLSELLEQQTAASEILKIISSSPGSSNRCSPRFWKTRRAFAVQHWGSVDLCEDDSFRVIAMHGVEPTLRDKLQGMLLRLAPNTALGRLSRRKQITHIADVLAEPGFFDTPAGFDGPGGNVTGATFFANLLPAKRTEVLHELDPNAKVFGLLSNPRNANAELEYSEVAKSYAGFGLAIRAA